MDEERQAGNTATESDAADPRALIRDTIAEYLNGERAKAEPAYKAELLEERKRREALERRVNELIAENERSRRAAEEAERSTTIRDELRRLGVTKVDLGYRAVKEDIVRGTDGRLVARTEAGETDLREYLKRFTQENPELLPARIAGGSGASAGGADGSIRGAVSLESIRPGMDKEQLNRVRQEIAAAISSTLHGV
jgi:hypothetical protein